MSKQKKIKLSISKPCTEDWDKMTASKRGYFCRSCEKPVVDFSNYTDQELLTYFVKAKERTCGRISSNQLNRLIVASEPAATPVYKRLLFGTALAAGVASTAHSQNNASNSNAVVTGTIPHNHKTNGEKPAVSDSTVKISGRVIDSASKKPLSNIVVMVVCDSNQIAGISTDANGKFETQVNKSFLGKTLTLIANQIGYRDGIKSFILTTDPPKHLTIRISETPGLLPNNMIMGDIEMVPPDTIKKTNK